MSLFITDAERIQLEEFLIDRQWKPGTHEGTWIQFRWNKDHQMDMPFFFLVAERRSEDVFEVDGSGIGNTWDDNDILLHITDVLRAGTDYGSRTNVERYLNRLGVSGAQGHAINILRAAYGDLSVPPAPETLERTLFFDADSGHGWCLCRWKGGESIQLVMSVKTLEADGYSTYSGYLRSCHGAPIPYPNGIFGERRKSEQQQFTSGSDPLLNHGDRVSKAGSGSMGEGDSHQPISPADLSGLSKEVLLEVRGEPGERSSSNEPGSGECDS